MTERMTSAAYRAETAGDRQATLAAYLRQHLDVEVVTEHRFHPTRRWRFDLALPAEKVAVEIHGFGRRGGHAGAHHSITGRRRDMQKLREAAALGWVVGEFESDEEPATVLEWVRRIVAWLLENKYQSLARRRKAEEVK